MTNEERAFQRGMDIAMALACQIVRRAAMRHAIITRADLTLLANVMEQGMERGFRAKAFAIYQKETGHDAEAGK